MMRLPSTIATISTSSISDRLLTFELPRRGRRPQRASGRTRSQHPGAALELRLHSASHARATAMPALAAGSVAEQLIQRVGITFFSATASTLFGDDPAIWQGRAAELDPDLHCAR